MPIPDDDEGSIADPQSNPPVLSAENAPVPDDGDILTRQFLPSPALRQMGVVKTSFENQPGTNDEESINEELSYRTGEATRDRP